MSKCINCDKEIEEEKVFGVIKRTHYDDRTTTADFSLGTYSYDPVAIIKVGVCKECAKKLFKQAFLKALKLFGIGFLLLIIGASVSSNKEVPETGKLIFGCVLIIGFIYLLRGIGGIIRAFIKKSSGKITLFGIKDVLKKEWMIVPDNAGDYSLKTQERSLSSRYSWDFFYVDEKKLQKPENPKFAPHSKELAMNTLKQRYAEKVK